MSAFSIRKQSPNQTDLEEVMAESTAQIQIYSAVESFSGKNYNKSPSVAIKSRQQANHDVNKRRTLLQDNSWIKKRPEEESADENYGRAVLNQYKSQDSLHSSANEKEDQKAVLGRYRSDTNLDSPEQSAVVGSARGRLDQVTSTGLFQTQLCDSVISLTESICIIPGSSDIDKINKSPTLNNKQNNRQSWTPNTSSANTPATSPIKKKRQSWMPPPVSSNKTMTETAELKHATSSENSEDPTSAAFSSEQVTPQKSKTHVDDQATASNQDPSDVVKAIPQSFTSNKEVKDLEDFTEINAASQKNKRDENLGDHMEVKSPDDQSKKGITKQIYENPPSAPNNIPEVTYLSDSRRKSRNSSHHAYDENITGNTIQTVYSTSDQSIIGKDICTYCRKPLGTDAKMILDALQICCHSTCFKCEVCKRPLEDLKAGDSVWIYRQTVHCEPCYSKIKEKWIY